MARMFSRDLTEQGIAICNADFEHLKLAELLTGKVILRALDTPDQQDIQIAYTFERGRCLAHDFDEQPAPAPFRKHPFKVLRDGLVRISAAYATWVKLDTGEIEPADALDSPDYQIEGNMLLLMPLMQAVNSWTAKIRAIPKEY